MARAEQVAVVRCWGRVARRPFRVDVQVAAVLLRADRCPPGHVLTVRTEPAWWSSAVLSALLLGARFGMLTFDAWEVRA